MSTRRPHRSLSQKFGDFIPLDPAQRRQGLRAAPAGLAREADDARSHAPARRGGGAREHALLPAGGGAGERSRRSPSSCASWRDAEKDHTSLADRLGLKHLTPDARLEEAEAEQQAVPPAGHPAGARRPDGRLGLDLAPLFAAAFATHDTWQTFLVGLAASLGAGISMGLAEALSDDGKLTGRGRPLIRGLASGIMTAVGGLGHALPYLIPDFWTATVIATIVVFFELWAISWIRWKYMDTPFLRAAFQVAVGGVLVFLTGDLSVGVCACSSRVRDLPIRLGKWSHFAHDARQDG